MDLATMAEGIIRLALAEDLGVEGDITTAAVCNADATGRATVLCKQSCRVAGQPVAARVFELASSPGAMYTVLVPDGAQAKAGDPLGRVEGPLAAILAGERTALNFLCHLSGIATVTARLVALAEPHGVLIMDTRKTTPALRVLEKHAVAMGGGTNHRMGLYDGVLIKDNHIAAAGGIAAAVARARVLHPSLAIEVEADSVDQAIEAAASGADMVLLDNMDDTALAAAVAAVRFATPRGRTCLTEASGGITYERLGSLAATGVDRASASALTLAPPLDVGLDEGHEKP